jgi:hypothetical protein
MTLTMPADPQLWLAERARELAVGVNALFHGTPYPNAVLASGTLEASPVCQVVCFSRSPHEAAFWATLPRDDNEDWCAVLVFDRSRLSMRYRLESWHDGMAQVHEQEERIWGRDVLLTAGLIGVASQPSSAAARDGSRFVIEIGSHELGLADNTV